MRTKRILIGYTLLFAAWMIWSSRAGNPPNGYTNAPFDNFCTSCHTASSSLDGTVSISGIPPMVEAGQTYPVTLTVTATAGSAVRAGFQLVSAFSDQSNAGDFIPNSSDEGSNTSGGREYIEHRGAKSFSSNVASWSFDWVAPLGPDGASITMYYAGNITNGNNSSSGDRPRSGSMTFNLTAAADPLMVSISKSDVSCQGLNDGSAQATASGGTSPYSYAWSDNRTTASIGNLPPGSYSVTVTDNTGSEATSDIQITSPPILTIDAVSTQDVLCAGGNSGNASITLSGGTEPYQINWSNGAMGTTITNLAAGDFGVTVTDGNDCQVSSTFSIQEPSAITLDITTTDESAFMAADGTVSVSTSGGAGSYSYIWNTGTTTNNLQGLAPGTYMLSVTDANGCAAEDMAIIQAFTCGLDANITSVNVDCFGNTTASASVSVSGATEPVSYSWSTGANTADIDNLAAGMYDVTVQDANQCQAILAIDITEPDSIAITFDAAHPLCLNDSSGQISSNITGGTAPYSYLWSSGDIILQVDGLVGGNYTLTITDDQGCTAIDSQSLTAQDSLSPVINLKPFDIYLDSSGQSIIDSAQLAIGLADNCAIDTFWSNPDVLLCSSVDSQLILISAVDESGNLFDTMIQVVVKDTIAPYFSCIEDIQVDSGQIVEYETPIPVDNCVVDTLEMIEGLPSGSLFPVGETKVSYMATDPSGNIGCCSFFVHVGTTTNTLDQAFSNTITIFPNPSYDRMWIDVRDVNLQDADLTIYDIRGAQMQAPTKLDSQNSIDVGHLASGLYFVMIRLDQTTAVKKVSIH